MRFTVPAKELVPYSTAIGPLMISIRSMLSRATWLKSSSPLSLPARGTPSMRTLMLFPPSPLREAAAPSTGSWATRKFNWRLSNSWSVGEAFCSMASRPITRVGRKAWSAVVASRSPVTTALDNSTQRERALSTDKGTACCPSRTADHASPIMTPMQCLMR